MLNNKEDVFMAKKKQKINVKDLTLKQLREALVNATGATKQQIVNEIARRSK